VEDLERALERLAADPEARRSMGRQARAWATAEMSWRATGARMLAIYAAVGAEASAGARPGQSSRAAAEPVLLGR
jgi:hypothetical protein